MTKPTKIQNFKVSELHFDPINPRMAEYGVNPKSSDEEVIELLWNTMDIRELVQSISASGFFPNEAVIVAHEDGKNIVIEGNRRLAAVKALLSPAWAREQGWDVPELSEEAKAQLETIPGILGSRQDSWRFLGFKHVNGPAKWSSYAKANYIAQVHRDFHIPLEKIAEQIGDRHKTVQRLFRGLMVLEQAEKAGVYDRENRYRSRLAFSHLYTGLDYTALRIFYPSKPKKPNPQNQFPRKK